MRYDIIGDVHGHLAPLEALLESLGYRKGTASWHHPDRKAMFLGDLIDRGPDQLGVVRTVRRMVDEGAADVVMGNHEFNAIGWASTDDRGRPLRIHGSRNRAQHAAFLDGVGAGSDLHKELVSWFLTLPLWRELSDFRMVHACWHEGMQRALGQALDDEHRMRPEWVETMFRKGTAEYAAAEILLKGPEIPLPEGVVYTDKDGITRTRTRTRWWDPEATTYRGAAIDSETAASLPDDPLPQDLIVPLPEGSPVFVGHYWMTGEPRLLSEKTTCLDFSVAKGGYLTSYAHDGEQELVLEKLSWVPNFDIETTPVPAAP